MEAAKADTKLYVRKVPILWWTRRWVDIKFITRELTSVFVADTAVLLLLYVRSVSQGPEAFAAFSEFLKSSVIVGLAVFSLLALLYHSITWLNLAPKAMVIKVGSFQVPAALIILGNYGGWAFITAAIFWLVTQS